MKNQVLTGLGILELGALALLWCSMMAAPLVAFERDLDRPIRAYRRVRECDRRQQTAV